MNDDVAENEERLVDQFVNETPFMEHVEMRQRMRNSRSKMP